MGQNIYQQTVEIKGLNNVPTKADPSKTYPVFQTSVGDFSCFEDTVVKQLTPLISQWVNIEIAIRPNGRKNLTRFLGMASEQEAKLAYEAEQLGQTAPVIKPEITPPAPQVSRVQETIHRDTQAKPEEKHLVEFPRYVEKLIVETIKETRINSIELGDAKERVKIYWEPGQIDAAKAEYEAILLGMRAVKARLDQDCIKPGKDVSKKK